MVFSSLTFLYLFLPLCLICYFASPTITAKNVTLTVFSLIFYAWGEPLALLVMLFSAAVQYAAGRLLASRIPHTARRCVFLAALCISLGLLAVFKYAGLLVSTVDLLPFCRFPVPEIALPIGISFYTFQCLSYTIDVYRRQTEAQTSFLRFLLFVSLFPQLIAGPILRYTDVASQIEDRCHSAKKIFYGSIRFFCGLLKKCAIANYAGEAADALLNGSSCLGLWLGILLYTFQIYFDFSGYSDMAIGLGKIFGFDYCENFRYPYLSVSVTEFWRRWHISLGSFFRDYVYIPLGGKYHMQVRNILIVWALTGLWHGASWNFLLWGLYYAALLLLEKGFLLRLLEKLPRAVGWCWTMFTVLIGWTIFYFTDIGRCLGALKIMFGGGALTAAGVAAALKTNLLFLVLAALASTPFAAMWIGKGMARLRTSDGEASALELTLGTLYCLASLVLCTMLICGSSYNPFLYFRF